MGLVGACCTIKLKFNALVCLIFPLFSGFCVIFGLIVSLTLTVECRTCSLLLEHYGVVHYQLKVGISSLSREGVLCIVAYILWITHGELLEA